MEKLNHPKGVLFLFSCFFFTLRAMFISSLLGMGVNSKNFGKPKFLYLLSFFIYLFSCLCLV